MQVIINTSRQRRADSRHLREICHSGAHHALQSAEVLQERPPPGGPESRDHLQHRLVVTAGTLAAMTGDREAVGLVADSLDQARRGRLTLGVTGAAAPYTNNRSWPTLRSGPLAIPTSVRSPYPSSASTACTWLTCPAPLSISSRSGGDTSPARTWR